MTFICRNCKRTFSTELDLALHKDRCSDGQLFCERCGGRFPERTATEDGWYYRCPTEDCDGAGVDEDLHRIEDVLLTSH